MLKRDMHPANWYVTFLGAALIALGYCLVAPITRDYETPRAFFAILTLNIGLLTVILGLAVNFTWLEQTLGKKSKASAASAGQSAPITAPIQTKSAPVKEDIQAQGKTRKQKRG